MIEVWAGRVLGWQVTQVSNQVPSAASASRFGVNPSRPVA